MPLVTAAAARREEIRVEYWPDEMAWTGMNEKGWFKAPRTLPLVLTLLRQKNIRGTTDPTQVYLELLSRHWDAGVVEMAHEGDHAYAAGYEGTRAVRTWVERMEILEKIGFIKTKQVGNQRYKYVFLVHPVAVVHRLRQQGKISDHWWQTYRSRQIETKEQTFEQREEVKKQAAKVISMVPKGISKSKKVASKK